MARWKASAVFGAILLCMTASARGQELCPAFKDVIEELEIPFTDKGDTSCAAASVGRYDSSTCRIPGVDYPGGEVVYKVRLNQGNEVSFSLDVQGSADLVLALVKICGDGRSCVNSSADFIGSGDEEISAAKYPPGIYYLYVDSVAGPCGPYELTVKGINPTPDLVLELGAPQRAVAGTSMTYDLSLTNRGTLAATGVEITQTLPEGITWQPGSDCPGSGRNVVCRIDELKKGDTVSKKVKVFVIPGTRGDLTSTAEVTANEGSPALPAEAITRVSGESDLSIRMAPSANPVVAGRPLTYTFTIHNAGPSDATQVKVIDTLAGQETFSRASEDWQCEPINENGVAKVICGDLEIPVGDTVRPSITVDTKPSALQALVNRATVSAAEREPACKRKRTCGPNSASLDTGIARETDLTISLSQEPGGEVAVGAHFSYILTVENKGPSDSSGATVTDCLPAGLLLDGEVDAEACKGGITVTRRIGLLPSGQRDNVRLEVKTAPDGSPGELSNTASVDADETDPPNGASNTDTVRTKLKIVADLRLESKEAAPEVCPGENILYTIQAVNRGPSNSLGGTIFDVLPAGLCFVSSPDGCTATGLRDVTCPVPPLGVNAPLPHTACIVAAPCGSETQFVNQASVKGGAHDPGPEDKSESVSTKIRPVTALAVTLTVSPDRPKPGEPLKYVLDVSNASPTEATDVQVNLILPEICERPEGCEVSEEGCILELGDISKDDPKIRRTVCEATPSGRGILKASASLVDADRCDPVLNDNTALVTTVVAQEDDVDLALSMTADKEVVMEGDLLGYSISVVNLGSVQAADLEVLVTLPEGATSVPGPDCETDANPRLVLCKRAALDAGSEWLPIVTVRIVHNAERLVTSKAEVSAKPDNDPNGENSRVEVVTQRAAALVLPFFEVDESGSLLGLTTLYSVRNLGDQVTVRYEYVPASPQSGPELLILDPNATRTVNLRDLTPLRGTTGYVGITPVPTEDDPRPALTGDFSRINPSQGFVNGERLISTDISRTPPELCASWSVRFHRGLPADSSTELLFFVPGNSSEGVVATGKVFAESGAFVQNVEVKSAEEAFRVSINTMDDGGLPLLAGAGSIEWTFQNDLVGNVTAVHKLRGKDEAAVPGFCRTPQGEGRSALILPYFKVDSDPNGATALLAVRNETDGELQIQVSYFDSMGAPIDRKPRSLAGHETYTVDLRNAEISGRPPGTLEGSARVEVISTGNLPLLSRALSGDYILFDGNGGLAGSALVDADLKRSPSQLCKKWDARFVQGEPWKTATSFVFYSMPPAQSVNPVATGTIYNEAGMEAPPGVTVPLSPAVSFLEPWTRDGNGSIEWSFPDGACGHVAMLFTSKGPDGKDYSVLIPGACREPCPTEPED